MKQSWNQTVRAKILLRIPSNEGGIEKGVEQHAVRMVQRGNDVTVYNRGGHNVFGKEFDGKKLKKYKGIIVK